MFGCLKLQRLMCVIKISICDMQYKISKPQSIKYICTCVQCTMQLVHPFCQVLSRGVCVFLKGGEKAVSDTKCHIGRDINCWSDASTGPARCFYPVCIQLIFSFETILTLVTLGATLTAGVTQSPEQPNVFVLCVFDLFLALKSFSHWTHWTRH